MKRTIFILIMTICASVMLNAQDTIRYPDPNYMYHPDFQAANYSTYTYGHGYNSRYYLGIISSLYQAYPINQPTLIYGIAATGVTDEVPHQISIYDFQDSLDFELYAVLIMKEGNQYYRVDSVKWQKQRPYRYFIYPQQGYNEILHDTIVPSFEFYFHTPIYVYDTIFIGLNFHSPGSLDIPSVCTGALFTGCLDDTYLTNWLGEGYSLSQNSSFRYRINMQSWGGYFPILTPRDTTRCDPVWYLHTTASTDTSISLAWDGGNASQWEVEYAESDGMTAYTVVSTVPRATLTGLRSSTTYLAHVRSMCSWDSVYGDWTHFIEARTEAHQSDTLIDTLPDTLSVNLLNNQTRLIPNPTSGLVTVTSSYRMERIAVYDLQGHTLIEQPANGESATLDVSHLPQGVYVLTIHTTVGIATKRLLVE